MAGGGLGDVLYFFGGVGAKTLTESILDVSDDFWRYEPATTIWSQPCVTGESPSARRCAGLIGWNDSMTLWGGSGVEAHAGVTRHTFLNDFWRYDPEREMWQEIVCENAPPARYLPLLARRDDSLFLFGGYTEDNLGPRMLNDLWVFDGKSWHEVEPPNKSKQGYDDRSRWPGVRYGSIGAANRDELLILGGFSDRDHNDLWRLDLEDLSWSCVRPDDSEGGAVPPPRYCGAAALSGTTFVLFGGRSRAQPTLNFNDLWTLDTEAGGWARVHESTETHRYDAESTYPAYHAKSAHAVLGACLYLLGGEGRRGHVSDFWRLHLDSLEWEPLQPARADDPILW